MIRRETRKSFNKIRDLTIDLSDFEEVFIRYSHYDHTGGLMSLKEELPLN